jgi:DNA-binding beta-propeller fold protein YncE
MPDLAARARRRNLVLSAGFLVGNMLVAQGQTPTPPDTALQVKLIRTIQPKSLRLSDRDRLSGGLPQKVPFRMATDSQGRILITEPYLSLIQVFDIEGGKRWQLKGENIQRMVFPTYIAVDGDDRIYVSEPMLASVLVFFPDGRFARSIGGSELSLPFGLAVDKAAQCLYVVDHQRGAIQVYSLEGKFLKSIGTYGSAAGELNHPTEITFQNDVLYVLDAGNARFQEFDLEGHSRAVFPFGDDRLPLAFAVDTAGKVYCVDGISLGLVVLDPAGNLVSAFGVRRGYGQPSAADRYPTYTSVTARRDGVILALRPDLAVDVLELETAVAPATSPEKPDKE